MRPGLQAVQEENDDAYPLMLAVSLGLMLPSVTPAFAQQGQPTLYEYDGKQYNTLAQCQRAKKRARSEPDCSWLSTAMARKQHHCPQ